MLFEALGQRPFTAQPVPASEAPLAPSSDPVAAASADVEAPAAPESDDLPHVGG